MAGEPAGAMLLQFGVDLCRVSNNFIVVGRRIRIIDVVVTSRSPWVHVMVHLDISRHLVSSRCRTTSSVAILHLY